MSNSEKQQDCLASASMHDIQEKQEIKLPPNFSFRTSGEPSAIPQALRHFPFPFPQEDVVTVADRRVRIPRDPNQDTESLYSMLRQWVRNDPDYDRYLATMRAREASARRGVYQKRRMPDLQQPKVTIDIPEIQQNVPEPTIDTHLPRWKALGTVRRETFKAMKAAGFESLKKRVTEKPA